MDMDSFKIVYTPMCQACRAAPSKWYTIFHFFRKIDLNDAHKGEGWVCNACMEALENEHYDPRLYRAINKWEAHQKLSHEFYNFILESDFFKQKSH